MMYNIKNSAIAHRAFLLYNILMNSKTPSLKNIFSSFFFEYWEQIKFNFDEKRRKNIRKNVCAFLRCGNPKFGYAEYICPDCFEKLVVPFTCKSKFCP